MARFPFRSCVEAYLRASAEAYAQSTIAVTARRFNRMERELTALFREGKIHSANPKTLSPGDVQVYYIFLKGKNITNISIDHDLNDLNCLCRFFRNRCVEDFRFMFPASRSRNHHVRLSVFTLDQMAVIRDRAAAVPDGDFSRLRAYALVALSLGGGLRTVEIQYSKSSNLSLEGDSPAILLDHVKGQDSYGRERYAALIQQFVPPLVRYLAAREAYLLDHRLVSPYLFFSLSSGELLTDKTLRQIRGLVEEEVEFSFTGRMCRRSYGQYLKDSHVPIEEVSRNMGHSTTKTTEIYYARIASKESVLDASNIIKSRKW